MVLPLGKSGQESKNDRASALVVLVVFFALLAAGFTAPSAHAFTVYSDDFNCANGNLGVSWSYADSNLQISSNQVVDIDTGSFTDRNALWPTQFTANQYAQIDITNLGGNNDNDYLYLFVRLNENNASPWGYQGGSANGYLLMIKLNSTSSSWKIQPLNKGIAGSNLASGTFAATTGTYKFSAAGNVLTATLNGSVIGSATDSTYSGAGYSGFDLAVGSGTSPSVDNWQTGGNPFLSGAQISSRSDTLSNDQPSATSNHTIAFTVNNALYTGANSASNTLALRFDPGFNLNNIFCKDVDLSFTTATTDNFNRANGNLGGSWSYADSNLQISSNQVTDTEATPASDTDRSAVFNASFAADQYAQIDVPNLGGTDGSDSIGLFVRLSSNSLNPFGSANGMKGYVFFVSPGDTSIEY